MNLLLVDDEAYVIESIKKNVDWESTGIEEIYTAFSIRQAQSILEIMPIDIIVSDIVMPGGSGFDFMSWVRKENFHVQVIFLTSYAEFDYARKAISFGSVDYLLKPIEFEKLTLVLKEAVNKVKETAEVECYRRESRHWQKNRPLLCQSFFAEVLKGTIAEGEIYAQMQKRQLDYGQDAKFKILYLCFQHKKEDSRECWEDKMLNFVSCNVLSEMGGTYGITVLTEIAMEKNCCAVILCRKSAGQLFVPKEKSDFIDVFLQWMVKKIPVDIWCGTGEWEEAQDLKKSLASILRMRENSLSIWNRALDSSDFQLPRESYENPNIKVWETLLEQEQEAALQKGMGEYLDGIVEKEIITRDILKRFQMDVMQMVYTWLNKQEIKAHLLFLDKESEARLLQGLESIEGAKELAAHFVAKAIGHKKYISQGESVTEQMKAYIDSHFREDIKREELSELVYLNTDYMSRIFKKEEGISISSYILQKRVEEAKKLLMGSELPINSVSLHVGYSNFSYFTKMFRENTGDSPLEYRRKHKGK